MGTTNPAGQPQLRLAYGFAAGGSAHLLGVVDQVPDRLGLLFVEAHVVGLGHRSPPGSSQRPMKVRRTPASSIACTRCRPLMYGHDAGGGLRLDRIEEQRLGRPAGDLVQAGTPQRLQSGEHPLVLGIVLLVVGILLELAGSARASAVMAVAESTR